jgi:hypothetical protein
MDDAVRTLDEQTFAAEARQDVGGRRWDQFLRDTLADGFTLRRSLPEVPLEGKEAMIERIAQSPARARSRLGTRTWSDERIGVVVSTVLFEGDRFVNVKVFELRPAEGLQCVYWQVTREAGDGHGAPPGRAADGGGT